ncbi:hypothetical protein HDC92_001385 [Pedobacter sp. AK017]|uniref:Wadjet anti-phage system protein JetD domain-containing protein n=1 Tax=Pedobacter sp. AK017 TaxID=2723073 RepID=UPI0016121BF4|nr:DUF3322 and DUF2220 domain-containing protein [Pedobacter sp. AK017]MBB5437711.1 hypothetical protein [Pedobacter sp. AK017]
MISPEEIKRQALKWWEPFLRSKFNTDNNELFFPKQIARIGKVHASQITIRLELYQQQIEKLYKYSKNVLGSGYRIKTADKTFRRIGTHEIPDVIEFETTEDYLSFIGKKKEYNSFLSNCELLMCNLPQLKDWIRDNSMVLTNSTLDWNSIITVCRYFIATPRPNVYLRQLPIPVHTKFIEENAALLQTLLNVLIPGDIRNPKQKRFVERYYLRHDEPLIRIRMLDEKLALQGGITDLTVCLSDFNRMDWGCSTVLIAENKMNFLTLPAMPRAIAIWSGGGFNVSHLKNALWLLDKCIFYWGDIDEHGFQILHQIRSYYQHTKSIMMDRQTFDAFQDFCVEGERNRSENLHFLDREEAELYAYLKTLSGRNRLEQEKILQVYVNQIIAQLNTSL